MDRVARLPAAECSALFAETAARMRTTPAVAEKDFWVTWVLDRLFGDAELARLLMFKGGTSLSKAYQRGARVTDEADLEGVEPRKFQLESADGIDPPAGHNPRGAMARRAGTPRGPRPCRA